MNIFLKFILKSAKEKKGKTFLLLFSIIVSTGLFICSIGVTNIMINNYIESYTQVMENRVISITSKINGNYFDLNSLNLSSIKDVIPELEFKGWYKQDMDNSTVTVLARNKGYIHTYADNERELLNDFSGPECVISKFVSTKLNINEGDSIAINLNNEKISFKVKGIYLNEGIFFGDTNEAFNVIVPYEYLSQRLNLNNQYNKIIANKSGNKTVEDTIDEINDSNSILSAGPSYSNQEGMINAIKEGRTICFALLTIVILLSSVIISNSFKLVITERMPVMGTFFSVGATKKNIISVLLLESSIFGLVGALIAYIISIFVIEGASYVLSQHKDYGVFKLGAISIYYILLALIFGLLLSVLSSIIPILGIRKLSIKDVILGELNINMRISSKRLAVGLILIMISIILRFIKIDGFISLSCILFIFGIILSARKIIDFLTGKLYLYIKDKASIAAIALNNVRTSKELLNSITLMLISALSVVVINSVGQSVKTALTDGFNRNNFQIQITVPAETSSSLDEIVEEKLNKDNIDTRCTQKLKVFSSDINGVAFQIAGIDTDRYLKYDGYVDWEDIYNKEVYNNFQNSEEPTVIISQGLAKSLKLNEGDNLKLKVNNIEKNIKIAGIVDMKILYGGYVVLIDNEVLKEEFDYVGTNMIALKVIGNPESVRDNLRAELQDYNIKIVTFDELERANIAENEKTIYGFGLFSLIAVVVASFGVLNNTRISYLNSKKNIALMHSLGMNRRQKNKMLIYQSLFLVLWVGILLIPCSFAAIAMTKDLLALLGLMYEVTLNIIYIPVVVILLLILITIATIPVIINGKKFSIINEIKYE